MDQQMGRKFGTGVFLGVLIGAALGIMFGAANGNIVLGIGHGALVGVFFGWFAVAAIIDTKK